MVKYILRNNLTGFQYPGEFIDIDKAIKIKDIENQIKHKKFFPNGLGRFEIVKIDEIDTYTTADKRILGKRNI